MTEDNVLHFPQPHGAFSPEERMRKVARLAERVAELMETDGSPIAIRDLLDRIACASEGLAEIGMLTLTGADRPRMQELCRNIQLMVARIRTSLAQSGVDLGRLDND